MLTLLALAAIALGQIGCGDDGYALGPPLVIAPVVAGPGTVKLIRNATSPFDRYLTSSSEAERRWIASAYWRLRGYDPFFSRAGALEWAGPTHVYADLYAIYRDVPEHQRLLAEHPEWVLRDEAGAPLFIPYDCDGTSCTQYAADVGNPAYRAWWISETKAVVAKGYAGVFVDDVNMDMRVSDGAGRDVAPIDPRTGAPMRSASWRRYVAAFTERIADELPAGAEIVHNAHWWVEHDDPEVQRQIDSADIVELERGYNDEGIGGGGGRWGIARFMAHIDWLHARGKSVILEPYGLDEAKLAYELAGYFLTREGEDAIASDYRADPTDFSDAWLTDLGAPVGRREMWRGLWRRRYARGLVLLNERGAQPRTVDLGAPHRALDGETREAVTLAGGSGTVLVRVPPGQPQ